MSASSEQALVILAWSRLWSPVVEESDRAAVWKALDLPGEYDDSKAEYWSTFHAGVPEPPQSLILHAALRQEGSAVREDWLRVLNYLELDWAATHLPPDQLGAACEIYACAIEREEPVLVEELRQRYLLPWCDAAEQKLRQEESKLVPVVESFRRDLLAISVAA